jgi:MoaA/NifB/PqqE/SkfB family radical SAM enzyme
MWAIETVRHLDLELTQQCNAACPMCARNLYGSQITTPEVTSQQLRLGDLREFFSVLNDWTQGYLFVIIPML